MKNAESMTAYNLLYYTPKLWERIVLWFCPLLTHEAPNAIVWYKKFANRLYICGYIRVRAADETYTTGSNMTQQTDGNSTQGYDNAGNN